MKDELPDAHKYRSSFGWLSGCLGLLSGSSGLAIVALGLLGRSACGGTMKVGNEIVEADAGNGVGAVFGLFTSIFGATGAGISWVLILLGSLILVSTVIWGVVTYRMLRSG